MTSTVRHLAPSMRLRTAAMAALFGFTTFFVSTMPTEVSVPRPEALAPQPVEALACADGPSFEGHITNTSSTTAIATYSTTGNVYGYISEVMDDWSCTAWYRYDGLAWARDDAELDGNFDWGNLINSKTVACNWGIGSTDYLKANSTTDCPDTDAEYALPIFLSNWTTTMLETVWHNDHTPDAPGDFAFIHSDCESYYGAESLQENKSWSTGTSANRPGSNCDAYEIDATNTTQSIVVDGTPPAGGSIAVNGGAAWTNSTSVTVTGSGVSDSPAGIADIRASVTAGSTWYGWTAYPTANVTLPTGNGTKTVHAQFRDENGNATTGTGISDTIGLDQAPPTGTISVDGGNAYSPDTTVTLTLSASDTGGSSVGHMRFSNNGTTWSAWEAYGTAKAWTLSSCAGSQTVRVEFRDVAQNSNTGVISDAIVCDEDEPTGSITINSGATHTATTSVTLGLTYEDPSGSGPHQMQFSNDGTNWSTYENVAATKAWTLTSGDGTKTVRYKVKDNAGNVSTTYTDTIVLDTDTTDPDPPAALDLDAGSDSGASAVDDVTNDATPTITGIAEAGATVRLYAGPSEVGSGTATVGGTWTITTSTLADGVHDITATATDASSNTSDPSGPLSVTIDTAAPAAPSTPDLEALSDTGTSDSDDITNDATPTVSGTAETGSTVGVYDGVTPIGSGSASTGTWSVTTSGLADGLRTITAKATDLAGNISSASEELEVTIDSVAPAEPSIPDLDAGSDSGVSATDDITNDDTPTLTGTAPAGTTVVLSDGMGDIGSGAAAAGTWSITSDPLDDGELDISARAVDLAGNASETSDPLTVVIDASGPTGTISIGDGAMVTPSTSIVLDLTSGDPSGVVSVEASNDGETYTAVSGPSPSWELAPGTGPRIVYLRLGDAAGNTAVYTYPIESVEPDSSVTSLSCTITTETACHSDEWPAPVAPDNTYAYLSTVSGCPGNGTRVKTIIHVGAWTPVVYDHGAIADGNFVSTYSGTFTTPASGVGSSEEPSITLDPVGYVGRSANGCKIVVMLGWVSGSTPWPENVGMDVEVAPDGTLLWENGATTGDPVQTFSGAFLYDFVDVATVGRGPTPTLTRSYNSADSRIGLFGPGWSFSYGARLREPNDATGDLLFVRPNGNTDRFFHETGGTFTPSAATRATLVRNADLSYTVTEVDRSAWQFDPTGRLMAINDRHGNTSRLWYDGDDRILVEDPAGRGLLELDLDGGRITSVTDWLSPARTVTYGYDSEGRLETVTDREGETTTFGYDGTTHRLTSITDARANAALTIAYDGQGRVESHQDARGLVTSDETIFGYVVNGNGTRVTTTTLPPTSFEPSFHPTIEDHYTADGWLVERTMEPSSTETLTETFTYDGDGFRTSATNARGFTTDFCYDVDYAGDPIAGSRGNLTRVIAPAPTGGGDRPTTLLAYDEHDNVVQTVAPEGVPSGATVTCSTDLSAVDSDHAVDRDYDGTGTRLLETTTRFSDPDLGLQTALTSLEYGDADNPGFVTRVVPARGNVGASPDYDFATTFVYGDSGDEAGQLIEVTDPLGNSVTYDHDAVGRLIATVNAMGNAPGGDPADHRTSIQYDDEDRVRFVESPDPAGNGVPLVAETRFDEVGNAIVRIDQSGQVTALGYDERNSLAEVIESPLAWTDPGDPPGTLIVTTYEHDAAGNVTRVVRADGDATFERATDYAFDGRGLVRTESQYPAWPSTAGSLVTTATYDATGNRTTLTDPLSHTTTFAYDRLDRLVGIDYADTGTPDVAYEFDAHGNRTEMTDGTGTTTYAWDEANRIVAITFPGSITVGYRHDLDGHRTAVIYPGADAVEYAIDEAGRVTSLTDWDERTATYAYEPDGALETIIHPNDLVTTYGYDDARRLTDITHALDATTIAEHHYTLDLLGRATATDEGVNDWTYDYDRLSRLTDVTGPDDTRSYAYDPLGNRTSRTVDATTTTYTHDAADRLLTVGATSVTVDAAGDLTARGSDSFDYDAAHRLIEATVGATTVATTYNGDGVRVSQQVGAGPVTSLLNDVSLGLPVILDDGTTRYVWGPAGLAWTITGSDVEVVLADRLGSTRATTDSAGAVVATTRTDEFGVVTTTSGSTDVGHGYTGEPVDPSELVYLRARHYDPELGRFLTRDLWSGDPTAAQTTNRYTYLANDPLNATDPSGRCGIDILADIGFIAFDLASLAFGPEKDRGINSLALGADITATFIPCATGAGLLVRGGRVAGHADDWAEISGIVRQASNGKGNFGLGSATSDQALRAGESWVGDGWRWSSDGKAMVSSDGQRVFRPPTEKVGLGKQQANFEYWLGERVGPAFGNGHLDVVD